MVVGIGSTVAGGSAAFKIYPPDVSKVCGGSARTHLVVGIGSTVVDVSAAFENSIPDVFESGGTGALEITTQCFGPAPVEDGCTALFEDIGGVGRSAALVDTHDYPITMNPNLSQFLPGIGAGNVIQAMQEFDVNTTMSLVAQLSQTSDCLYHFSVTICEAAWRLFGTEVARWTGDVYMLSGLVDRVDDSFDEMMNALSLVLCEINDCTSRPTAQLCIKALHAIDLVGYDDDFEEWMNEIASDSDTHNDIYDSTDYDSDMTNFVERLVGGATSRRRPKHSARSCGNERGNDDGQRKHSNDSDQRPTMTS